MTETELDALRKAYATSLVRERSARIKRNLTLGDLLEWHKAVEQALEDGAVFNKRLQAALEADNERLRQQLAAAEEALEYTLTQTQTALEAVERENPPFGSAAHIAGVALAFIKMEGVKTLTGRDLFVEALVEISGNIAASADEPTGGERDE